MEKKKSVKRFIPLFIFLVGILAIVIAIVATPTKFYASEREDGTYDLEVRMVNRVSKKVTVPAYHEGVKVTSFLVEAYNSDDTFEKVTTLILSEGIEEIELPLLDCFPNLERLELPSTIKAVYGNISDSIEVVIASGAEVELKSGCFISKKTMTVTGSQDNAVIPDGVKVIGEGAFSGAKLDTIKLPASVERIEALAFSGAEVAKEFEIDLGTNIKYVGYGAFASKVTISKVTISTETPLPSSLFGSSKRGGAAIKCFVLNVQPNIVERVDDEELTPDVFEVSAINNADVLRYIYIKDDIIIRNKKGQISEVRYKQLSESDLEGYKKYTTAELTDNQAAYTMLSFVSSTSDY